MTVFQSSNSSAGTKRRSSYLSRKQPALAPQTQVFGPRLCPVLHSGSRRFVSLRTFVRLNGRGRLSGRIQLNLGDQLLDVLGQTGFVRGIDAGWIVATDQSASDMLAQRPVDLELLLAEQLVHGGYLRECWVRRFVGRDISAFVAADRRFDVDQRALFANLGVSNRWIIDQAQRDVRTRRERDHSPL